MYYRHEGPSDQRYINANVRDLRGGSSQDALGVALKHYIAASPGIKSFYLGGPICIDESLFWPPVSQATGVNGWTDMKTIGIDMSQVRPDGGWYLENHPDIPLDSPSIQELGVWESDEENPAETISMSSGYTDNSFFAQDELPPDEEYDAHREGLHTGDAYALWFRSQPTPEFEQVLEAVARAAGLMTKLQFMAIGVDVWAGPRTDRHMEQFDCIYEAKGYSGRSSELPTPAPTLRWPVPREWKMGPTLEPLWREVLGSEGVFTFEYW